MPTLAAAEGLSTTFQRGNRQPHQWLATTFRELFKAYPQVADPSQFLRLNGSSGLWTRRETSPAHSSGTGRKRRRTAQTMHNEAMCLLALGWMHHPRWRLVMTGNRDEFHARPTAALAPGRMRPPSSEGATCAPAVAGPASAPAAAWPWSPMSVIRWPHRPARPGGTGGRLPARPRPRRRAYRPAGHRGGRVCALQPAAGRWRQPGVPGQPPRRAPEPRPVCMACPTARWTRPGRRPDG